MACGLSNGYVTDHEGAVRQYGRLS